MQQVEEISDNIYNPRQPQKFHIQNIPEATPTSKQRLQRECRICLEADHPNGSELVAPCSCTGSVEYIHVACFQTWVQKKLDDPKVRAQILGGRGVCCEICKEKYQYSYTSQRKCASSAYFCRRLTQEKIFAIASIFFMVLGLSLLSAVICFALTDPQNKDYDMKDPRYFLIYLAMVVSVLSVIFGGYHFIKYFLIESKFTIIPENKQKHSRIIEVCQERLEEKHRFEQTGENSHTQSQFLMVRPKKTEGLSLH